MTLPAHIDPTHPFLRAVQATQRHHAHILACRESAVRTSVANHAALLLLCEAKNACGECGPCKQVESGAHPDFHAITPNEKNTIPIEAIRDASARLGKKALYSSAKVLVLHDAHRMNPAAQNALLKTLEEPPGDCYILLTTTYARALLVTVRSRSMLFSLPPSPLSEVEAQLQAADIPAEVATPLAHIHSSDVDAARSWVEDGFAELHTQLTQLLEGRSVSGAVSAASDWGSDETTYRMALAALEYELRERLKDGDSRFVRGVDELMSLRESAVFNPNRTMSLERVLLSIVHG